MKKILLLFFCLIYISAYSQGIKLNGLVSAENNPITNVADPTEDQDAATKSYVDSNVNNSSINSLLAQINANIQIVDGRIVSVDGKLDNIDTTLASNQSEALTYYLNTMTGIGRVEVDLEAVDADNAEILQQLASMLTVNQNGFANQSAELTSAEAAILVEITLVQQSLATTLLEIAGLEALVNANQSEALIYYINTMTGIGRVEVDLAAVNTDNAAILQQLASLEASIQALQADVTTLLGD
jgi:hypothetical protein